MSPIRQRFVPDLISASNSPPLACRRPNPASKRLMPLRADQPKGPAADPHLAPGVDEATRCRREQKAKTTESAIRLRFVPPLVERLISGRFSPAQDPAEIAGQATNLGTRESLMIQHLVGKSDSKSILSREQKLNHLESAIRR